MTAAQSRAPGRLVTLNPFELGASSRQGVEAVSPAEIGCVDWYRYPVNRNAHRTGVDGGFMESYPDWSRALLKHCA